ncbi:MAG: hypothetical protein M3388_09260 [Acidobacteriota bacterium]|nr:hypothetical protein [Acidobacteriota bacterium]
MIEIIKNNHKEVEKWRLSIDNQIIDGVEFSNLLKDLTLEVDLEKTSAIFFNKKLLDFVSLQNENISDVEIIIVLKKILEKEAKDLFLTEFNEDEFFGNLNLKIIITEAGELFGNIHSGGLLMNYFWKNPFSLIEYNNFVQDSIGGDFDRNELKQLESIAGVIFPLPDKSLTLSVVVQDFVNKFKISHQKAFKELVDRTGSESLITRFFDFPDEVRIPCEQYLLYFAEFLRNLGINTTADIKHEAGEILFSVTPDNPNQALNKIRVALEIFLNLPKSEIIIVPDQEFEIAMLKAKANIDHLNSQLSLAKAEIRVKEREIQAFEATLETKDISIEFLREKLN